MRFKLLTLFAAVLLVAACETAPEETAATDTTGVVETPTVPSGPGGPPPGSQEDLLLNVGDRIFFAFDRSDLNANSRATLEKLASWLTTYQNVTITIEGHCDERGTREYNLALGERRANAAPPFSPTPSTGRPRRSWCPYSAGGRWQSACACSSAP